MWVKCVELTVEPTYRWSIRALLNFTSTRLIWSVVPLKLHCDLIGGLHGEFPYPTHGKSVSARAGSGLMGPLCTWWVTLVGPALEFPRGTRVHGKAEGHLDIKLGRRKLIKNIHGLKERAVIFTLPGGNIHLLQFEWWSGALPWVGSGMCPAWGSIIDISNCLK